MYVIVRKYSFWGWQGQWGAAERGIEGKKYKKQSRRITTKVQENNIKLK